MFPCFLQGLKYQVQKCSLRAAAPPTFSFLIWDDSRHLSYESGLILLRNQALKLWRGILRTVMPLPLMVLLLPRRIGGFTP
jgi:hypothetical protein